MNGLIIILTLIFAGHIHAYGQNDYYFDKWKAKGEIIASKVLIIMDSTNSDKGKEFNEKLGRLLSENLKRKGISASYTFKPTASDNDALMINLEMIKPAYVKLNTFEAETPLCNRFEITQVNKTSNKRNRQIRTTLSISVDKEEIGLKEASEKLADLIYESIKK